MRRATERTLAFALRSRPRLCSFAHYAYRLCSWLKGNSGICAISPQLAEGETATRAAARLRASQPSLSRQHDSATSLAAAVEAGRRLAIVSQGLDCLTGPRSKFARAVPRCGSYELKEAGEAQEEGRCWKMQRSDLLQFRLIEPEFVTLKGQTPDEHLRREWRPAYPSDVERPRAKVWPALKRST